MTKMTETYTCTVELTGNQVMGLLAAGGVLVGELKRRAGPDAPAPMSIHGTIAIAKLLAVAVPIAVPSSTGALDQALATMRDDMIALGVDW